MDQVLFHCGPSQGKQRAHRTKKGIKKDYVGITFILPVNICDILVTSSLTTAQVGAKTNSKENQTKFLFNIFNPQLFDVIPLYVPSCLGWPEVASPVKHPLQFLECFRMTSPEAAYKVTSYTV